MAAVVLYELVARLHRDTGVSLALPDQIGRRVLLEWAWKAFGDEVVQEVRAGGYPAAEAVGGVPTCRPADGPRMQQLAGYLARCAERPEAHRAYGDPPLDGAPASDADVVFAALVPDWAALRTLVDAKHWSDDVEANVAARNEMADALVMGVVKRLRAAVIRNHAHVEPLTLVNTWRRYGESLRLEWLGDRDSQQFDEQAVCSGAQAGGGG